MKKLAALWTWLASRSFTIRFLIKLLIFLIILMIVVSPNPVLNVKQIAAYTNTEALFAPFPELETINAEIDSLLPEDYTFKDEYNTIVRYVYQHVPYQFDWDNWVNAEYWPSAQQTWERGKEDCDGRAILAVAIFRSRGYADANIVGSMRHLWIKVAGQEGMGPDTEKIMVVEDGRKKMRMPPISYLLEAFANQLYYYPECRMAVIVLSLLVLIYHPTKNLKLLLAILLVALLGFMMILDWADYVSFYEEMTIKFNFILGSLLLVLATLAALFSKRILKVKN